MVDAEVLVVLAVVVVVVDGRAVPRGKRDSHAKRRYHD
jgi:hypothetical protein